MDPRGLIFSGFRSGKTTYKRSACEGLRLGSHPRLTQAKNPKGAQGGYPPSPLCCSR